MNDQRRDWMDRFGAMQTRALLARYCAGGLLPQAEAALLEVLADRGYAGERLQQAMAPPGVAAPPPVPKPAVVRVRRSHPELRGFNRALRWLVSPVLLVFVLMAIPILGNFIVLGGASALGCRTGEDNVHPCHFLFWDIGSLDAAYMVDAFVAGAANPIISCFAFLAFVESFPGDVWFAVVLGLLIAREVKRSRLQQGAGEASGSNMP